MLSKTKVLGQLHKFSIQLSKFDIQYVPLTTVKGQILVDFLAEILSKEFYIEEKDRWTLYVNGSSNKNGSEIGLILVTL